MQNVKVDFSKATGQIKPVNAVNNGPAGSRARKTGNFDLYQSLHIPYARLHDSAFYNANYGGEYSVDVHRVFPNFDADENDPASYLFGPTDTYLQDIQAVGTKIYYRLGAAIEHGYKRGTYPPKDFAKWARICEHIIMHYTQGWANGFYMDIEYWEIWNEPDCTNGDGSHPCWQGTPPQFVEFFITAITYLKGKFPKLKIGGPAICWIKDTTYAVPLLEEMQKRNVPLDFFSFHAYTKDPHGVAEDIATAKQLLQTYGYGDVELHLNEWNYVRGWSGKDFEFSIKSIKGARGAALTAGVFCVMQKCGLDMGMYYDARPCAFCGLFQTDTPSQPAKGFYAFKAWDQVAQLKQTVYSQDGDGIYTCATTDGKNSVLLISHTQEPDNTPDIDLEIEINGLEDCTVEYYLVDDNHDLELVETKPFEGKINLHMPNCTIYLVKFKAN